MKIAAEEKRKREEEDEIALQARERWLEQDKMKRNANLEEQKQSNVHLEKHLEIARQKEEEEDSTDDRRLKEEEMIIHLGRLEAQKEYEEKRYDEHCNCTYKRHKIHLDIFGIISIFLGENFSHLLKIFQKQLIKRKSKKPNPWKKVKISKGVIKC